MDCSSRRIDVASDPKDGNEEIRRLQGSINDLISLQALPAIWNGRESGHIVSTLLDVLVSMLRLNFAYARLRHSINGSPVEFVRLTQRRTPPPQPQEIGRALDCWLTNRSANAPLAVPNPADDGEVRIAPLRLGLMDEIGVLVAGSKRADFPTPTETLLLRVAANQALVALQEARQLHEQRRAAEELERRVTDRTAQLTTANEALRESEKKYRTLFDSIDEGFCTIEVLFDGNNNPIDYRFLEVNPSFEKQTGIQHARGRRMREIAPQHEERWFEIYGRIALTGEPVRFENQAAQLQRWYDVYAFRVGEPGDRKVAILFNDITERKQAEAKLRQSESNLAEAQRLTHTGSWVWRVAGREAAHLSEEWYRIYGFDPEEGMPAWEERLQRVHPEDRAKWQRAIDRAIGEKSDYEVEFRILLPDGTVKYIHTVGHPVLNASGDLVEFVGSATDITERKRAEMLLGGEKRLLEMIARGNSRALVLDALCHLVEELNSGSLSSILLLDPKTNRLRHGAAPSLPIPYTEAIDGLVIGPCMGSCGTAAYRAEPVIVSDIASDPLWANFRDLAGGHGLRACWSTPILSSAGRVLGTFAIYYRESRTPTPEDSNVIGQITHLASIAIERAQATQALQQQANLLDQAHDAIFIWEFPRRTIVYWNRGAEQLYGFSKQEAIGRPSHELLHTEHPMTTREFEGALERDGEWTGELTHTTREGRKIIVESRHVLMSETAGRRLVLETNRDITDRKRAEAELREAQADLAHVSRATTMGELTASLAHEVNQPITAAVTNANTCVRWLAGDTPNIEEARDAAMRSAKDGTRAAEIISRIRLLFKKGTPERKLVDVNEVIREMIVLLRGEATRYSISVRTELGADLPQVMGDRVQFQQVMRNLIMNSIDAIKDLGETRELAIKSQRAENEQLLVTVSDTGVGLPGQQADEIFNAFFTTKLQGTGLGLSISRSIVESHGGRLWAAGNTPRGASFHFTLS